jgi:hypothetical protein
MVDQRSPRPGNLVSIRQGHNYTDASYGAGDGGGFLQTRLSNTATQASLVPSYLGVASQASSTQTP